MRPQPRSLPSVVPSAAADEVPRVRHGASLAATMGAASLMQFTVGALAPLIVVDLDLTRTRIGLLLSGYYLVAALTSPTLGWVAERLGHRAALRLVVLLALVGNLVVAALGGQLALAAGLLLSGLAVAAANPATNLALAALPPPHGALMGFKQSGFQVAAVVAGTLMPLTAGRFGWRSAFVVAAGLAVAVLLSLPGRRPPSPSRSPAGVPGAAPGLVVGAPRRNTGLRAFSAYAFFMGIGTANVGVYLALYGHEVLRLPVAQAGALVAVVGVAAVAARIGWSVVVERSRGCLGDERVVLRLLAVLATVAAVALLVAEDVGSWLVWPAAVALGASAAAWNGVVMLALLRNNAGSGLLGRASGAVQGAFFLGLATGPPVFGLIVDRFGDYSLAWAWTALSFVAALGAARVLQRRAPSPGTRPTTPPRQENR